jgi:hypothetical protein
MSNTDSLNKIMNELSDKVNKKAVETTVSALSKNEDADKTIKNLSNIMNDGAKEFENRVGRPITYAEMRSMWG